MQVRTNYLQGLLLKSAELCLLFLKDSPSSEFRNESSKISPKDRFSEMGCWTKTNFIPKCSYWLPSSFKGCISGYCKCWEMDLFRKSLGLCYRTHKFSQVMSQVFSNLIFEVSFNNVLFRCFSISHSQTTITFHLSFRSAFMFASSLLMFCCTFSFQKFELVEGIRPSLHPLW